MRILLVFGVLFTISLGVFFILIPVFKRVERHSKGEKKIPLQPEKKSKWEYLYGFSSLIFYPLLLVSFTLSALIVILLIIIFPPGHSVLKKPFLLMVIRFFSRLVLLSTGVRVKTVGKEQLNHPKPLIIMANHQSIFDSFILGAVLYRYVVAIAASYQFDLPVWGAVVRRMGAIPINREDLKQAIASIEEAKRRLAEGFSIFVSPEGTRTVDGKLREFKKGPFHLAISARADILPMAIKGAFDIKRKTDWKLHPGGVEVRFGKVILHEEFQNLSVDELRDIVRNEMLNLLGEASSRF